MTATLKQTQEQTIADPRILPQEPQMAESICAVLNANTQVLRFFDEGKTPLHNEALSLPLADRVSLALAMDLQAAMLTTGEALASVNVGRVSPTYIDQHIGA